MNELLKCLGSKYSHQKLNYNITIVLDSKVTKLLVVLKQTELFRC